MKRLLKSLFPIFCLVLLCSLFSPFTAQAASSRTPGKVIGLTASAGESYVILKWQPVSKATAYRIYAVDTASDTYTRVATTSSNKITLKELANNVAYTYCVSAYRTVKNKKYEGEKSKTVTVTPKVNKPAVPALKVKSCGNKKISLKWNSISGATYYNVYQKNKKGKFVLIGTTKNTSVTVKKLTNGKNYQFRIRAVRKVGAATRQSNISVTVTAKPLVITNEISNVHSMYYKATVLRTVKAPYVSDSSKKATVKAGTRVTVMKKSSGNCKVRIAARTYVYIAASNLNITDFRYDSSEDYSSAAKEGYINSKGYSSPTKYLIWISLYRQRLYVFKGSQCNWKLFKTYKCSTGRYISYNEDGTPRPTATPSGLHRIWKKEPRAYMGLSYMDNASFFSNGNAIHGWVWVIGTGWDPTGSLGNPASHGCVRLANAHAKYIYDYIPMGTTVAIY